MREEWQLNRRSTQRGGTMSVAHNVLAVSSSIRPRATALLFLQAHLEEKSGVFFVCFVFIFKTDNCQTGNKASSFFNFIGFILNRIIMGVSCDHVK